MRSTHRTLLGVALLALAPAPTLADAPEKPLTSDGKEDGEYQFFVLGTTRPKIYQDSTGDAPGPQPGPLKLGEVFYAQAEKNGRVLLGEFDGKKGWTSILGWVAQTDLIANRLTPLTVAQALEQKLPVRQSAALGGLNPSNVLHLRCVTKPDSKVKPGSTPEGADGPEILRFVWFYIYEMRTIGDVTWLLAGHRSTLTHDSAFAADSQDTAPARNLVGWIPLKATDPQFSLWCSNEVIEFSCDPAAVNDRMRKNRPATVFANHDVNSGALFQEPLDLWKAVLQNPAAYPSLQLDPIGVAPDYPRFVVIQSFPGDWVEVASVGSSDGSISQPEIALMKIQASQFANSLRKVDLAFVVDRTGSMTDEIAAVVSFLAELSGKLRELEVQGTTAAVEIPGQDPLVLDVNLDIRVSLFSYNEQAHTHFVGLDLKTQSAAILRELAALKVSLAGGFEAVHPGMNLALDTAGAWRDDCETRMVLLIGDEPGDTHEPDGVLARMKAVTEAQYKNKTDLEPLTPNERKKKMTPVYSIYTSEQGLDGFRTNVLPFSAEVLNIPGLSNLADRARLIDLFYGILKERQTKIKTEINMFLSQFKKNPLDPASLPGVSQIALEEAARRVGLKSVEEFRKFSKLAFFQGFAYLHDLEWSKESENPPPDPFRVRVMLSADELSNLADKTGKVGQGLIDALDALKEKNDPTLFGSLTEDDRKLLLCRIFVQTRDSVVGTGKRFLGNEDALNDEARKLLAFVLQGKGNARLARLLRIPDSLPIRADSILAKSLEDFVNMNPRQLRVVSDHFKLKAKGLDRIKNSQVIPEDFLLVEDPVHAPGGRLKSWFFTQSLESNETYCYVPLGYIP